MRLTVAYLCMVVGATSGLVFLSLVYLLGSEMIPVHPAGGWAFASIPISLVFSLLGNKLYAKPRCPYCQRHHA